MSTEQIKVTIPPDIVAASRLNFKKPIYLYYHIHEGCLYLTNRKHDYNNRLYGIIELDANYSFTISENLSRSVNFYIIASIFCCTTDIVITFHQSDKYLSPSNLSATLTIPPEFLNITTVNFKKPLYFCKEEGRTFLSNRNTAAFCFGRVYIDKENCIVLNRNICIAAERSTNAELTSYIHNKKFIVSIKQTNSANW